MAIRVEIGGWVFRTKGDAKAFFGEIRDRYPDGVPLVQEDDASMAGMKGVTAWVRCERRFKNRLCHFESAHSHPLMISFAPPPDSHQPRFLSCGPCTTGGFRSARAGVAFESSN